jgi:Bacterial regulatory proteins, luxR family
MPWATAFGGSSDLVQHRRAPARAGDQMVFGRPRASAKSSTLAPAASPTEIAQAPFVSDATVKTLIARVLMRLNLRDRAQAVIYYDESGLARPGADSRPIPPGDHA